MKKYLKILPVVLLMLAVVSCGGGSSSGTPNVDNPSLVDMNNISISSLTEFPANTKGETFVTVNNNSSNRISGLTYAIGEATTGNITIDSTTAKNCANLSPLQSCNLKVIFKDANANPGAFSVIVSGSNATLKASVNTTIAPKMSGVGLVNVPSNMQSGASGAVVLVPDTITQNTNGLTPIIVTVVVNSANIGDVNTFALVDTVSHQPLSFATNLSGNNLNGGTNFSQGETVSFLLNIPKGINQVTFQLQAAKNGLSSISYSNNMTTINLVNNKAIVSLVPSQFNLVGTTKTQQVYVINTGDNTATGLSLPNTTLNDSHVINVTAGSNNSCGSSLASGSYCSYTVNFDTSQIIFPGSATLNLSYNNGASGTNSYATVFYSGVNPDAGLLNVTSSTYRFNATTASPIVISNLLLTNISTSGYTESNITLTLPQYFSLANSGSSNACSISGGTKVTTVLQQGESCSVSLVYTNPNVMPLSLANLNISYSYTDGITQNNVALNPIGLVYSTSQSSASLSFANQTVVFSDIRSNNNDSTTKTIQLINNGQITANNLNFKLSNSILGSYTIVNNNCGGALAAGASCSVNVRFGPTLIAKTYSNTLIATYANANNQAAQQATTNLTGTAIDADDANLVISNVSTSQSVAGDGTMSTSSFQFLQSANNQLVLTYKNIGENAANNISINTSALANGYNLVQNQCTGNLVVGNTCNVILSIPNSSGVNNLDLSSLSVNWSDGSGVHNNQIVYWQDAITTSTMYTVIYVNVFEAAHIVLSSLVDLSNAIPGANFNLQVTLVGGFQVPNTIVTVSGFLMIVTPSGCTVSSNNPSCSVKIITYPTQPSGDYWANASSNTLGMASFPFTLRDGRSIYITQPIYSGNLAAYSANNNGIEGADYICNHDKNLPENGAGLTYKAMVVDDDRSTTKDWVLQPKMLYVRSDYLTTIGTTDANAVFRFPLTNSFGKIEDHVWTGLNGLSTPFTWNTSSYTCNNWTTESSTLYGNNGLSDDTDRGSLAIGRVTCDQTHNAALYCVQQ